MLRPQALHGVHPLIFLLIATVLEVCGDATVRTAKYNHVGLVRLGLFICGAVRCAPTQKSRSDKVFCACWRPTPRVG